jgi:metal-responsive CopG/Arc/MetJ family transcriptional regulator
MTEVTTLGISLPKTLVKRIDDDRGDIPRSRFLLRLVERAYSTPKETVA